MALALCALFSVAAVVGLWLSVAAIAEAAVLEHCELNLVPAAFGMGRASGFADGWPKGYSAGATNADREAKRRATEFRDAQHANWIGPLVEFPYVRVRVPERVKALARFEDYRLTPLDLVAHEVTFRCVMYAHNVHGVLFKHARWELDGVEAHPLRRPITPPRGPEAPHG